MNLNLITHVGITNFQTTKPLKIAFDAGEFVPNGTRNGTSGNWHNRGTVPAASDAQPPKIINPEIDPSNNRLLQAQDGDATAYVYDAAGNLTKDAQGRNFQYDAENKQTKVVVPNGTPFGGAIGEYVYDGDGRRVKKTDHTTGEITVFVYDAFGKLATEYSNNVGANSTPQTSYMTTDTLGSPRVITDQNGNVTSRRDFLPFGEDLATPQRTAALGYTADTVRQKFATYERDNEADLDFAQARYYNYRHGRFTSIDPLLSTGEPDDPQTWNRYAYALNNPYFYTDPTGMYVCRGNKEQCEQFETRLNQGKDNLKKIEEKYGKDSSQYKKANDSLNAYGAKDEKNGVFIAFNYKGSGAATTGTFADKGKGKLLSVTVNFNAKELDNETSQSLVGHEGNHVNYFQTVGNNTNDKYSFEFRGHEVQSLLLEAQYPNDPIRFQEKYDIWNPSWEGPDKETLRSNAIKDWLAVPKSQGGYDLKPLSPQPKPPASNRPRRRRG